MRPHLPPHIRPYEVRHRALRRTASWGMPRHLTYTYILLTTYIHPYRSSSPLKHHAANGENVPKFKPLPSAPRQIRTNTHASGAHSTACYLCIYIYIKGLDRLRTLGRF
ncbi:hypothetical protein K449DRAFT_177507 [Hypoxylon sp. EC38]|nr:hypothetical protein K449DRAFT_177507 [Hypoxylon sp. EC38]